MFKLPENLTIGAQVEGVSDEEITAFESSLPQHSRVLVGLNFDHRYEDFEADCAKADVALRQISELTAWPEYPQFVTPDPDGLPIAWVSYVASPEWQFIAIVLGGLFLLPILGAFSLWVVDKLFPGFTELLTMLGFMIVMFLVMSFVPKMLSPAKG
jgi:hypothetical protein